MSLGLISGYGSDSEGEEETSNAQPTPSTSSASAVPNPMQDRLKSLSEGGLFLPPPPPPEEMSEPLPNPMKHQPSKAKKQKMNMPGMSKKEMELMMKNAKWMDITTEAVDEDEKTEFEYNTPLPFSYDQRPEVTNNTTEEAGSSSSAGQESVDYDYMNYVAEYQNYMAQSAALMEGQERSKQLAEEAAAAAAGGSNEEGSAVSDSAAASYDPSGSGAGQLWDEYQTKYRAWYAQYGGGAAGGAPGQPPQQPQLKQKTFEELLEQDRQLEQYFNSEPPNEYNTQRDAFKSSFRGTRRYRMLNGGNYNARHFNQLSSGAKKFAEMYPKQKSVFVDKDAYIADKDLPENQDIKSNKQRKKDKWFQGMVEKKKGCKKCGYVFCRCYGWEYKPSHVK